MEFQFILSKTCIVDKFFFLKSNQLFAKTMACQRNELNFHFSKSLATLTPFWIAVLNPDLPGTQLQQNSLIFLEITQDLTNPLFVLLQNVLVQGQKVILKVIHSGFGRHTLQCCSTHPEFLTEKETFRS